MQHLRAKGIVLDAHILLRACGEAVRWMGSARLYTAVLLPPYSQLLTLFD